MYFLFIVFLHYIYAVYMLHKCSKHRTSVISHLLISVLVSQCFAETKKNFNMYRQGFFIYIQVVSWFIDFVDIEYNESKKTADLIMVKLCCRIVTDKFCTLLHINHGTLNSKFEVRSLNPLFMTSKLKYFQYRRSSYCGYYSVCVAVGVSSQLSFVCRNLKIVLPS